MTENKLVQVEVTTTLFVDPDKANNPEWREQVRSTQQALGALGSQEEVQVTLSFDGREEEHHDAWREEHNTEVPRGEELGELGEEVLGMDMTSFLLQYSSHQTERANKLLGSKLRSDGLKDVRAALAVGSGAFARFGLRVGDRYSDKSEAAITAAFNNRNIVWPSEPSVEDVARFCDSLDQVPGHVLRRIAFKAECELLSDEWWNSGRWVSAGLLKRSVADLCDLSLDYLTLELVTFGQKYPEYAESTGNRQGALKSVKILHRMATRYAADFTTAKEALNS